MPYVDLAGLSRFDGKLKDFASSACAGPDMANWQKTPAAGAVSFLPVPEMPLDPVVNFLFTESGPASGTKGPDNPSTITGVTQAKVTRCGKNLLSPPNDTRTRNGITLTNNNDGTYTVNGTASADTNFNFRSNLFLPAGTYIISGCPSGGSASTFAFGTSGGIRDYGSGATFSLENLSERAFWVQVSSGATVTNVTFKPQLELGSAATAFEPYDGADYTVNLGGAYYGGSVDLSTGVMTVTWVGESINSADHTAISVIQTNTIGASYITQYRSYGAAATLTGLVCNKFEPMNGDGDEEHVRLTGGVNGSYTENIYINRSRLDLTGASDPNNPTLEEALAAVNAWLAVNPIFIAYRLFTPFTVSLTPTQIYSLSQPDPYNPRINTVYSDQISVQVGYPKSPQATQNELTNAVVSLGGNV